jgi:hypothetical protein
MDNEHLIKSLKKPTIFFIFFILIPCPIIVKKTAILERKKLYCESPQCVESKSTVV